MSQETKTKYFYSPSINIVRDSDSQLNYIPTYNSKVVFEQLVNAANTGIRSFNIVGAYGTGKSSFLWAIEKDLNHDANYFSQQGNLLPECTSFVFFDFVGEYKSIQASFSEIFESKKKPLIDTIKSTAQSLIKENKGLVIRIDEFGKFLEHAAQNHPEKEIYFLQQLAELCNDDKQNVILLTTLHQDFSAYAYKLDKELRNEWDKVKGRFKEITFNEPVEQLLLLAAERLSVQDFDFPKNKLSKLNDAIDQSQTFPLKDYFNIEIAQKLLPLDIIAASTLTISLQRYGQNERSLFSFIEANDHLGLNSFLEQNDFPLYNLVNVYDYLNHHFYNYLHTKYNPDYTQWAAIRSSIERAEGLFESKLSTTIRFIKIIGLLNIFSKKSGKVNKAFLKEYASAALGVNECDEILESLEFSKIIRYIKYKDSYVLFEGTDVDIELAINQAGKLIEVVKDVAKHLNEAFDLPYISAKKYHYETGTPRYFEYKITEEPISEIPKNEIDGFINLVFSTALTSNEIKLHSSNCKEAILFVLFKNTDKIIELVTEIEKIKKAKQDNEEDRIAVREFDNIIAHQEKLLNHFVVDKLQNPSEDVEFYFSGKKINIEERKTFNHLLSEICYAVYSDTPHYQNEMVNKTKLSSQISLARKNLITRLLDNHEEKDLGFSDKQYPPEKTIYLSLIKEIGIHKSIEGNYILREPTSESFDPIWKTCTDFLEECKQSKRPLNEIIDRLLQRPIKVKQGFIDFWLPIFLIVKKDDFALFGEDGFIPFLTADTLELVIKKPKEYEIKAFDVEGIKLEVFNKYRELINQSSTTSVGNDSFIETIKPFLAFYRGLPEYAKKTKKIPKQAQKLRTAISQSKDPEKAFFEEFPEALGYSLNELNSDSEKLERYFNELRDSIKQIRTSYQQLLERFESFIQEEVIGSTLEFEQWRSILVKRFESVKTYTLNPQQKTFLQRVNSPLDDKKAWLNSVAQAVLNNPLDQIADEEEYKLYDKFKELVHELDNLSELAKEGIDEERENVFKLEITSFLEGVQNRMVRMPKSMNKKSEEIEKKVKSILSKDKNMNIFILTELLKEQLKNNE